MRHAKALLLVVAFSVLACASMPRYALFPPYPADIRVTFSRQAMVSLESLATVTRMTRREQSACVRQYTYAAHRIAVEAIGPGEPTGGDSLHVWTLNQQPMCGALEIPVVHSHIVRNEVWGRPSEYDSTKAADWPQAPFSVLVSVGDRAPSKITIYGVH